MREFDLNGLRLAEYQAKLFEASVDRFNCSTAIFLRRFLHSDLLETLDKNNSAILNLYVSDGLDSIEEQFGPSNYGKVKFSKDSLFWIGYLYRYISYTKDISTRVLFKTFSYTKLNELYYVYHTQDIEWVISNILELHNLTEDFFDKNYRLKKVMYEYYFKNSKE